MLQNVPWAVKHGGLAANSYVTYAYYTYSSGEIVMSITTNIHIFISPAWLRISRQTYP